MKKYLITCLLMLASTTVAAQQSMAYPVSTYTPASYPHSEPANPYPYSPAPAPSAAQSLDPNKSSATNAIDNYRPQTMVNPATHEAQNNNLMFLGNSCGC